MTVDYLALTRGCTTQNQFNRVHIDLEVKMTPLEFAALARDAEAGLLPDPALVWLAKLQGFSSTLASVPVPYLRQRLRPNLEWLRPRGEGLAPQRVLLAFCGDADRLMLPLPVFLQELPAPGWDVLKVTRTAYRLSGNERGLIEKAVQTYRNEKTGKRYRTYLRPGREIADLRALVILLRRALASAPLGSVTCIGTSSGGKCAILVALLLGLSRCVIIGGQMSDQTLPLLPRILGPNPAINTDFTFAFPSDNPADRAHAERLMGLFGGRMIGFRGIRQHGLLAKVAAAGGLPAAMDGLLNGTRFPEGMVDHAG